jgi:hypothetical protein
MKVFSLLLIVAILLGSCAPTCKNIKADEEYQMTFVDKMKILGGLFVAYLKDTDYKAREQRKYIIYDRWNNYLPIYDVVEVGPNPVGLRERREKRDRSFDPFDPFDRLRAGKLRTGETRRSIKQRLKKMTLGLH